MQIEIHAKKEGSFEKFVETIKPVLEKRIAESEFKGLTDSLRLSYYQEGIELVFKTGKLKKVKVIERKDVKDMHIALPPKVIYQLILGYLSFDELSQLYPDVSGHSLKIPIVNVLFPKIHALLTPEI